MYWFAIFSLYIVAQSRQQCMYIEHQAKNVIFRILDN